MGRSSSRSWIIGTAVLCVLLLGGSWFVLVAPVLDAAAGARAEAGRVAQQNLSLQARTVELREQFADIDRLRAELADLQTQIPPDGDVTDLLREIDAVATSAGVTITSVGTGDAVDAGPAASPEVGATATAPVPEGAADPGAVTGTATAPDAAPDAAPVAAEGLVAIPVEVTVVGTAAAVTRFVAGLQTALDRLVLVDSLTGSAQPAAEAASGRPATAVGDVEMTLSGYAYVLPDPTAVPEPPDGQAPGAALPDGASDRSLFAPNAQAGATG